MILCICAGAGAHASEEMHITRVGVEMPHGTRRDEGPTQQTHTGDPHRGQRGPTQGTHTEGTHTGYPHIERGGPHRLALTRYCQYFIAIKGVVGKIYCAIL